MTHRPTIGIVAARYLRPNTASAYLAGIGERYIQAVEAAGGIPLLLHLTRDAEVLDAHYRRCDALLFAGGGDVAPAHFGAVPHPKLGVVEELRDEVELALARRAAADGMPLLGICRGIQLLNVALGGTLYQDIPAELPANTFHHQALRDLAPSLRMTGQSPDGVIEAVEGSGPSFVLGVQCHPEEMWDVIEPRWARLFQGFVDVARQGA